MVRFRSTPRRRQLQTKKVDPALLLHGAIKERGRHEAIHLRNTRNPNPIEREAQGPTAFFLHLHTSNEPFSSLPSQPNPAINTACTSSRFIGRRFLARALHAVVRGDHPTHIDALQPVSTTSSSVIDSQPHLDPRKLKCGPDTISVCALSALSATPSFGADPK